MGGEASREALASFATAVILVAAVVFLVTSTPAASKGHTVAGGGSDDTFVDIGTALTIEKQIFAVPDQDGGFTYQVVVANESLEDAITLDTLTDAELGETAGPAV